MTLGTEHDAEISKLKQRIAALRDRFSGVAADDMIELMQGMMHWLSCLDDEIDELDSRVRYLEREDEYR